MICDLIDGDIFVLAFRHSSMDLQSRIAELEPQLIEEAQILHDRIAGE